MHPEINYAHVEPKKVNVVTVRRPSWIEFTIPGTEVQNYRKEFATKGKAKRFVKMLRKEHGPNVKIERSWIVEV
jgi:hypothetical protein